MNQILNWKKEKEKKEPHEYSLWLQKSKGSFVGLRPIRTIIKLHLDYEGRVLHKRQLPHFEVGDFQACTVSHPITQGTAWLT